MANLTRDEQDALYRQARLAVIQKIDYWNKVSNPSLLSAFNICQQLAIQKYGKAYYLLSLLFDAMKDTEGQERAQYFAGLAFDWSIANQSNHDAELWCDLGEMYMAADGNFELAAFWFSKAAEQGYAEAQYNLAVAYRFEFGVPENLNEALRWCQLAAEQGHAMAIANLVHIKEQIESRLKRV